MGGREIPRGRGLVGYLPDLTPSTADAIASHVAAVKRNGDIAIASIHWGGNWGYDVLRSERGFARELVDHAGIDVVHGHSSHHAKGIEIHRDRPIIYGCGDFLNDYEGIGGYESFRSELGLMYFPTFGATGALEEFTLVPTRIRHFRVNRARGPEIGHKSGARGRRHACYPLAVWDQLVRRPASGELRRVRGARGKADRAARLLRASVLGSRARQRRRQGARNAAAGLRRRGDAADGGARVDGDRRYAEVARRALRRATRGIAGGGLTGADAAARAWRRPLLNKGGPHDV